jgi:hypothetical protein
MFNVTRANHKVQSSKFKVQSMKTICLYFEIHQITHLKRYRFFDIGTDHYYYDDYENERSINDIAERSYMPALNAIQEMIEKSGQYFKVAFSLSGVGMEQLELHAPQVLEKLQELNQTGCVEFLAEPYSHGLSSLANRANTYRIPMDSKTKEAQNMDGKDMDYYDNQQLVYGSNPCKKFDDSQTASNQKNTCYRDIHIITLPEMYLVAAEAYLKAGDNTKALARLNEVHQRAGLAALTGTITIDNILDESACENFGNCARWMDLRRTKTLVERCTKYNYEMGDKAAQYIGEKLLRPIPQAAIDANDQLSSADQNPGY